MTENYVKINFFNIVDLDTLLKKVIAGAAAQISK
jgi:hypothetical protein